MPTRHDLFRAALFRSGGGYINNEHNVRKVWMDGNVASGSKLEVLLQQ